MKKNENKKESKKKIIYVFIIIGVICLCVFIKCFLPPIIERVMVNKTCSEYGKGWKATYYTEFVFDCPPGSQCDYYKWSCCPSTGDKNGCIGVEKFDISDFK